MWPLGAGNSQEMCYLKSALSGGASIQHNNSPFQTCLFRKRNVGANVLREQIDIPDILAHPLTWSFDQTQRLPVNVYECILWLQEATNLPTTPKHKKKSKESILKKLGP